MKFSLLKMTESYLPIYLICWTSFFVLLCLLILAGLFNPGLIVFYIMVTWLSTMIINFYEGHRLLTYLREHHYDTWAKITDIGFGPGSVNSFYALQFVYSPDDFDDASLTFLKNNCKQMIKLVLGVFFHYPLVIFLLFLFLS